MKNFVVGILIGLTAIFSLTVLVETARAEMNSMAIEVFIDNSLNIGVGVKTIIDDHLELHLTKTNHVRIGAGYYDEKNCGDAYFGYGAGLSINLSCCNPEGYIRILAGHRAGDARIEIGAINYGGADENTFLTIGLGMSLYDDLDKALGINSKPEPKKNGPDNPAAPDPVDPDNPDPDNPVDPGNGDKPGWGHGDKNHNHYGPPGLLKK